MNRASTPAFRRATKHPGFWILMVCALLSLASGCARRVSGPASAEAAVVPFSRELAVKTFDTAWQIIHDTHFDTNFGGVNWVAAGIELRPLAEAATNQIQLRDALEKLIGKLSHSHMALIPREVADAVSPDSRSGSSAKSDRDGDREPAESGDGNEGEGDLGIELRLVDGALLVFRLDASGPAAEAGVRMGWTLDSIEDGPSIGRIDRGGDTTLSDRQVEFYAWAAVTRRLKGNPGSKVRLRFLDGDARPVQLELERRKFPGIPAKLGNLPTFYTRTETRLLEPAPGVRAGWIHFNVWMLPVAAAFDRAMDEFRGADGIVVDLRGNLGGIGGMVMGIAGHFLNDRLSLGTMKMRGNTLHFFANPRRVSAGGERVEPFAGPMAILTDSISLSAAEVFAGGMQDIGRARVFGSTSAGQALPALFDRLPNGDVLYHAVADFVTGSGVRLEHRGVVPDVPIPLRREDLLRGRDPALDAALAWIADSKRKGGRPSTP